MCNRYKSGEWDIYEQRMIELYGKDAVEELKQKARLGGGPDSFQMRQMIVEYRKKVKQLRKEKGL